MKYPIARYQLTQSPAGNLLYISPQNPAWQNNITFQTNLPWKVNNWWNMSYGFVGGLRQFKLDHTIQPFKKTYFGYSVNFNQAFKLPKVFLLNFRDGIILYFIMERLNWMDMGC